MSKQKSLLGGLVPSKEEKNLMEGYAGRLAFCFSAPIIAHPSWASIITQAQKSKATTYRLAKLMKGNLNEEATDFEAMLWLSTASLDAPLDRNAFNIYAYLFRKCMPEQANEIFDDHEGVFLDKHMEEPLLRELKTKIYKSQKEQLKKKAKKDG